MPGRYPPLIDGQVYHVFNRGIAHKDTFLSLKDYGRANLTLGYYQSGRQSVKLSRYLTISEEQKQRFLSELQSNNRTDLVDVYSYCLMPNHFHLLLRQNTDNGISRFIGNFQNSYTRYFNVRHDRDGSLFLDQFKAVHISTDEELVHVSRYIHLNPYTSFLVKTIEQLDQYPWSSLPTYLNGKESFIKTEFIKSFFAGKYSYAQFVHDQTDYQRQLDAIYKHTVFE